MTDFVGDVFGSLTRVGWQQRASQYIQGLMLDGRRNSIQPMAARMHAVHDQALNHFVTNSPWDVTAVRQRLAQRLDPVIGTGAWAIGAAIGLGLAAIGALMTGLRDGEGLIGAASLGLALVSMGVLVLSDTGLEGRAWSWLVGLTQEPPAPADPTPPSTIADSAAPAPAEAQR